MLKLQGIFSSITTPFDHNGKIYKVKVRHNVGKWNMTKLAGYVVAGLTGEGALLTSEEKICLWGLVAEQAASDRLLLAATGVEGVRETISLTNKTAEIGYQAAMIRTPHFYRNLAGTPEAQELYFNAVADAVKIPVIIQNSPQTTGVDIATDVVARLSEHPNVIAIKESSGNLEKITKLLKDVKKGFQVLVGNVPALATSLQAGSAGAVLAFANAAPYACITIWEAYRMREQAAAMDWQSRIEYPTELVTRKYGIPGLKYAMDLNGYYGGPCRLPFPPLSSQAKSEIEDAFADLKG